MVKIFGLLLSCVFLENLFWGRIAVGFAIKICDSYIYDAVRAALEDPMEKDVSVVGGMIGVVLGINFGGGPSFVPCF